MYDMMHLDFGLLRIREKGSSGGHNGVADIQRQLKSEKIPQLRIGIGKPAVLFPSPSHLVKTKSYNYSLEHQS